MRRRGEALGLVVGAHRIVALAGDARTLAQGEGRESGGEGHPPRVVSVPLAAPLLPGTDPGGLLGPALRTLRARLAGGGEEEAGGGVGGVDESGAAAVEPSSPVSPEGLHHPPRPVRVALLPPLVEVRFIPLPPLRAEEARMVLRRDVARHVPGMGGMARGSVVVGVGPHRDRPDGSSGRMVAVASQGLVESLLASLRGHGFEPRFLAPALAGWGVAGARAQADRVAVEEGETLFLVGVAEGGAASVRRLPLEEGGPSGGRVFRPGASPAAAASAALAALFPAGGGDPDPEGALLLRPPSLEVARREREGRLALRLAGVALLLLLLAGALHTLGARSDLRAVQEERRALASEVAPVLLLRDSLDALEARLAALATAEARLPAWGFPLVELATLLPPEAHLTGLRLAGDTLAFDAEGGRAGDVLAALRASGSFREPRVEGTIQRVLERPTTGSPGGAESGAGAGARERFTLSALLVRERTPPVVPGGEPEEAFDAPPEADAGPSLVPGGTP